MKKLFLSIFFVVGGIIITSNTQAAALRTSGTETITIVADVWCPYNCSPESYNPGFMIEIAREVFKEKEIEIAYSNIPWARAIEEARKGNYTAIVGATKGDAPDFIFPDIAQGISKNGFYVRAGETWKYNGLNSLKDKIVGAIEDYDYAGDLGKYMKENKNNNLRVQFVSGDEALSLNIKKLLNRRIDVIVEDEAVMSETIQRLSLQDKIVFVADSSAATSEDSYLFLAFSPKNPRALEYAKILSQGTTKLRESGRLQEILEKYNVQDWKK
jgi:polar amino acid transport system substrate-binding protein